ncbi:MAG: ABC transporter permease, partial [Rhizobium sp.]
MSLSAPLSSTDSPLAHRLARNLGRYGLVLALVVVFAIFTLVAPTFLSFANLQSVLVNNFTLLAIVSVAMTFAVSSGGIDLSVGTAVDMASFAFVSLVLAGQPVALAVLAGLAAGGLVGAFNAVLISGIGISPFLATLGTLFIGRSIQQMLTDGGNPVYLPPNGVPAAFRFLGHGTVAGVPTPLIVAFFIIVAAAIVLARSRFGRVVLATGIQPSVVRYSGLSIRAHIAVVFITVGV